MESEPKMLSILARVAIANPKPWCGEGKEMERFFAETAGQKLDILIVLGGDGTIRRAADACTETSSYLIALPGGTMNMLPRALYGLVMGKRAEKYHFCPFSENAFRRSGREQKVFCRCHSRRPLSGYKLANLCAKGISLMLSKGEVSLSKTCLKPRCVPHIRANKRWGRSSDPYLPSHIGRNVRFGASA